ncbi:MAG: ubiquitin-like domain-containing protein [Anaerolineae bacterium]
MAKRPTAKDFLRSLPWLIALIGVIGVGAFWSMATWRAGIEVTVTLDGVTERVRTTRNTVGQLLADLEVNTRPADQVSPALDAALAPDMAISVRRARPGIIEADGTTYTVYTHAQTVGDLLADAGLRLADGDEIWLDGAPVQATTPLPPSQRPAEGRSRWRVARPHPWTGHEPTPVQLTIRRAVTLVVDDGTVPFPIHTTAATVGEALLRAQVTLYLGDNVQPALGTRVQDGLRVIIERSRPVLITADRRTVQTRTRGKTVGDALVELGVIVSGNDRVTPALDTPVRDNTLIKVVRVLETVEVEREAIPFASVMVADPEMEIDNQRLVQQGVAGERRKRFKVTVVDGQEISRVMLDDWIAAEPITRVVAFGTRIVWRTLDTPDGPITYWRKIRAYATSYSPARSGTPRTAPWYGITRSGLPAGKGLVGVDPTVIPLGTRLYVPGYGKALAADTGSGLFGKWLDLGYSDDDFELWHWWVDVYFLEPVPPYIRWVLPNWPQYPDRGGTRTPSGGG